MPPDAFSGFAAALTDPDRPVPANLCGRDRRPAGRRFAVYRNNVVVGLVDTLAARFPVVAALVGEAFFRAAAGVYVRAEPPQTPLLHDYGAGFAAFLADFPPAAEVGYLADVARLEWAVGRASVAADALPLGRAALSDIAADRVVTMTLALHPSVQVVASDWPILALWRAHQPGAALPEAWPEGGETVLVLRDAVDRIVTVGLDAGEVRCLQALRAGAAFGDAAAPGLAEGAADASGFDPGTFLITLIDLDAIVGVILGESAP